MLSVKSILAPLMGCFFIAKMWYSIFVGSVISMCDERYYPLSKGYMIRELKEKLQASKGIDDAIRKELLKKIREQNILSDNNPKISSLIIPTSPQ